MTPFRPLAAITLLVFAAVTPPRLAGLTVEPPTFPELVAEAQTILSGRVSQVVSQKIEGQDGPVIRTFVTLLVDASLKGEAPRKVVFSYLGGRVGAERLEVPGMPRFEKGSREVVFLRSGTPGLSPLVGVMHGRYRIARDAEGRDRVLRDNRLPLHGIDEVALPLVTANAPLKALGAPSPGMLLPEFEAAIRQEVARQAVSPLAP